jgi:hypothetical protein
LLRLVMVLFLKFCWSWGRMPNHRGHRPVHGQFIHWQRDDGANDAVDAGRTDLSRPDSDPEPH